jgi:hypothetical protein
MSSSLTHEERFRALAAKAPSDTWEKLIQVSTQNILKTCISEIQLAEFTPEQLGELSQAVSKILVDHTNVTLMCVTETDA